MFGSRNKPPVLPGEQENALVKISTASYKQAEKKKLLYNGSGLAIALPKNRRKKWEKRKMK